MNGARISSTAEQAAQQDQLLTAIIGQTADNDFEAEGLEIYQRNLIANASRALAISYPTVEQLLGEEDFTVATRFFIAQEPPVIGDWGVWGAGFPAWIKQQEALSDYPYLADCAQLDWYQHCCERAENSAPAPETLAYLSEFSADSVVLQLSPACQVVESSYPVVDIWSAHRPSATAEDVDTYLSAARQKLAQGVGQNALIWREQWVGQIIELNTVEARWWQALIAGCTFAEAIQRVEEDDFPLSDWLLNAVQRQWILGVARV